jgi:4-hydroxy-tetrahydrodipicolinate reductase
MNKVKVIIWGFGAMGSGMADMLLEKDGVNIVGVCDLDPNKVGKSVFEVLDTDKGENHEVIVEEDIEKIINENDADIAILATDSFTKRAFDKIKLCLENDLNVVSTAEEMAYPQAQSPELTKKLDKIAKENGVSVLGTGINPGLIMDLLVVMLTGACKDVEQIKAERVNDLSPFGPAVMEEQGVGTTVEEFKKGDEDGSIAGHVGFHESIQMIADALGWELDGPISQAKKPIVSNVDRKAPHAEVKAGNIAGVNMTGQGMIDGEQKIDMVHPQQIEPQEEDEETGDYITIKGNPDINMSIKPEVPGGIGTIAMCVNMIPHVINANPGLKTMLDLPVPRAIMGDMRNMLNR